MKWYYCARKLQNISSLNNGFDRNVLLSMCVTTLNCVRFLTKHNYMGKMADVSLIEFIPAKKKIEASALYNDELLENSFLNKFNASDELAILHEEQLKTPNALDGNAGMSLITNKLESSLDLHDLEKFIDKKYCETRQRDGINQKRQ